MSDEQQTLIKGRALTEYAERAKAGKKKAGPKKKK
jgi:hypothetical protein